MVELGKRVSEDHQWLMGFIRDTGAAVIASNSGTGHPESAYIHVAAAENGRIIFGTNARSRKFHNIVSDPRVSLVIVQDDAQEIQLEGEAAVLEAPHAAAATEVLAAQHPDAAKTNDPENLRVLEVTVRWARHVDTRENPPARRELEL